MNFRSILLKTCRANLVLALESEGLHSLFHSQPPTRSPQKTRQGETRNGEKEETEIVVRNKQETASRPPPPLQKKSIVPSTVSRKVMLLL